VSSGSVLRIGVPDLISPSYFPVVAAVDLGFFDAEGLPAEVRLVPPVDRTLEQLRDGALDLVGGSAHSVCRVFPRWAGANLLAALSQNTYWLLVVRSDLGAVRGDLSCLRGLRIGAAPLVDLSLRRLLVQAGLDEARDGIEIGPVPGAFLGSDLNFGVAAARALEAGLIDGFWANGMGAEVSVRSGAGTVLLDARRGDGPPGSEHHTFPALIATETFVGERGDEVAAAVRALTRAQQTLRDDPGAATRVGAQRFPAYEATLIADLVARDAPFYDAAISRSTVDSLTTFQRDVGLLDVPVGYADVVASSGQQPGPDRSGRDGTAPTARTSAGAAPST